MNEPAQPTSPAEDPATAEAKEVTDRPRVRREGGHGGLGSLVGAGGSQVGTNAAMRARDVSRPR